MHTALHDPPPDPPSDLCVPWPLASPSSRSHMTCRVHMRPSPGHPSLWGWLGLMDSNCRHRRIFSLCHHPSSFRVLLVGGKGSWWSSNCKTTKDTPQSCPGGTLRTAPSNLKPLMGCGVQGGRGGQQNRSRWPWSPTLYRTAIPFGQDRNKPDLRSTEGQGGEVR